MPHYSRLVAGSDEAEIQFAGAELLKWRVAGRDLLWTADPAVWPRTSPILFPIVGWARNGMISVDGQTYPMGVHGFAAASTFALVEQTADSVHLRLVDDAATRAVFPFAFQLDVTYRLGPQKLAVMFAVTNTGDVPLPYALGWHPGFAWPFSTGARDQYAVVFDQPERPEVPVITAGGLFSTARRPVPFDGRKLALSDALLANEALCFLEVQSQSLRFTAPDGATIRMAVENFPHVALWSRPPAPFLCIEAWTGHGDPEGFDGDITEKPSMRLLSAGDTAEHAIRLLVDVSKER